MLIRPATPEDRGFAEGLVPRLHAFGPPALRAVDAMNAAEAQAIGAAIAEPAATHVVFVAELEGERAGVAYLREATDYFTGERHGHLDILMVAESAEGRGVARALIAKGEEWARARGYRFVTLMVFAGNERAIAFYESGGYGVDMIRYVKEIR